MLNHDGLSLAKLREGVTSLHGRIFVALQVFESGDLETIIRKVMRAA
jgi:hypothetical protein